MSQSLVLRTLKEKGVHQKKLTLKTLRNISAHSLSLWGIMCITSPNNGSPLSSALDTEDCTARRI